jgi:hypothetical protein
MSLKPKVALAQDFLLQLARLPMSVHAKVMKWAIKSRHQLREHQWQQRPESEVGPA